MHILHSPANLLFYPALHSICCLFIHFQNFAPSLRHFPVKSIAAVISIQISGCGEWSKRGWVLKPQKNPGFWNARKIQFEIKEGSLWRRNEGKLGVSLDGHFISCGLSCRLMMLPQSASNWITDKKEGVTSQICYFAHPFQLW